MSRRSVPGYDDQAKILAERYESLDFSKIHEWLLPFLPEARGSALDVGAGSGRDAKGLLDMGFEVVAVEPSFGMRKEGMERHPDPGILWVDDALPGLDQLVRQGLSFDVALVSAVWMHVSPEDRPRAFRKILSLLKPGAILAMTLRQGPPDPGRHMYESSLPELEKLVRTHGVTLLHTSVEPDRLGRSEVIWVHVAMKVPDDETGALPLLRHTILKSDKSSTYKLGLLRSIARIADGSQGMGRIRNVEAVSVPLGLVGLFWIRLYKPLLSAGLPQTPNNRGVQGLGFVREAWHHLNLSPLDLRPGMRFSGDDALALHRTIQDAVDTIAKMPAHYMTYPGTKDPLFRVGKARSRALPGLLLDEEYLRSFGEMLVPVHIWNALSRYDVWIEPALQSEWMRLMQGYLDRLGIEKNPREMFEAMKWSEPRRDVSAVREIAQRLLENKSLFCVWSGKRLRNDTIDIDHCFPWSAWPCDDLWNLLPAHQKVNRSKSDKLPSSRMLLEAADRVMEWWYSAFSAGENSPIRKRFYVEAQGTLVMDSVRPPASGNPEFPLERIFDALSFKRFSLKSDQGIEEWDGSR